MGKKNKIKFEIDLISSNVVGVTTKEDAFNDEINAVNVKISNSIKQALLNSVSWIQEFKQLIIPGKYLEAFELLIKHSNSILINKSPLINDLLLLNDDVLNREQRKQYWEILIVVAHQESVIGKIEHKIDQFILEYESELEPAFKQGLLLAKANAAAQNKKFNVANTYYKQITLSNHTEVIDIAFAFRGLSLISAYPDDEIFNHLQAADKFLEAGNKNEAIKDIMYVSSTYEKSNPHEALRLIDRAIGIYNGGNGINKEVSAGLYHRKALYLHSLNSLKDAFTAIEIACKLRINLVGNEHEKHSCFFLAKTIADKLKYKVKSAYYEKLLDNITPLITSEEFKLQQKILSYINTNLIIDGELLQQVTNSGNELFLFSIYLHNGKINTIPFIAKIEWLDKANAILNDKIFDNSHYALLYSVIGDTYLENKQTNEAILNYEKCLSYNPYYHHAIQNCGAIMWKEKLWTKSLTFFKDRIDALGETPVLCYAYGRSFFECGDYQQAFDYFRKAQHGQIKNVDIKHFIDLCLNKDTNLKLNMPKPQNDTLVSPILLEDFQFALEHFSKSVSSNSRMHFWQNINGKYKWKSHPEEEGKQLLINALEMKFGKDGIDISQERIAGAGIIDLYITLRGGSKVVVELKICGGAGYSSTYALSGKDQLIHYLDNVGTNVGFLIVFDGRTKQFGKGFQPIQSIGNSTIFTIAIDMNPQVIQ
ncbi:MAG TPA: hypothetical protein VIM89_05550 [Mucilaginibacter sp.]